MGANIYHRLNLNYNLPAELEISLATTSKDLKSALHLVHLSYLARGYTNDHHHQMRLNIFHAQPSTVVVVGKINNQVIATGSLIVDSFSGIPSEKVQNLDLLRQNYLQIVEGSALAVDENYRGANGTFTLPIIKYLIFYAKKYLRADLIVANVNPKQERFYRDILLFDSLASEVDAYDFVQGAPGTILALDLQKMEERYKNYYGDQEEKSNLYQYMFAIDFPQFKYPKHQALGHLPRYLGPDLLSELFIQKESLIPQLALADLMVLRIQYSGPEYDSCFAQTFLQRVKFSARQQRFATSLNANLAGFSVQIKNISGQGNKIVFSPANGLVELEIGCEYPMEIDLETEKLALKGEIIWLKHNSAGVHLIDPPLVWYQILSSYAHSKFADQYEEVNDYPTKIIAFLDQTPVELANFSTSEMKIYFRDLTQPVKFLINERYFLHCHVQQQDFRLEVVITWIDQYVAIIQLIGVPTAWEQALKNHQQRQSYAG